MPPRTAPASWAARGVFCLSLAVMALLGFDRAVEAGAPPHQVPHDPLGRLQSPHLKSPARRAAPRKGSLKPVRSRAKRATLAIRHTDYEQYSEGGARDLMLVMPDPSVLRLPFAHPNSLRPAWWNLLFPRSKPSEVDDPLQLERDLDVLNRFRRHGGDLAVDISTVMNGVLGAVHAPRPLRLLFDGPVHVGASVFPRSGVGAGAGIGGTLP